MLRHRFLSFFVILMVIQQLCLTYAALGLLGYGKVMKLEMLGPMIAAAYLIWLEHGTARLWHSLRKLTIWRVHPVWYFHALFWMPMAAFVGVVVKNVWIGDPLLQMPTYWSVIPETGILMFMAVLTLAVSEEFAWFGYGFAILYARMNAFKAAVVTGLFWGLSYIPMWTHDVWIAPGQPLWTVIIAYIAWALICVWIYNSTRSAFLLALMQIASNYSYSVFLVLPHLTGETLTLALVTIALLVMGLGIVLVYGAERMTRSPLCWKGEWDRSDPRPRSLVQ